MLYPSIALCLLAASLTTNSIDANKSRIVNAVEAADEPPQEDYEYNKPFFIQDTNHHPAPTAAATTAITPTTISPIQETHFFVVKRMFVERVAERLSSRLSF